MTNLKAIFALPKWAKVFLGVLSVVAGLLIVATLWLNQSVKGEIYSANLVLKSKESLESSNQIAYNLWIDFPKFKPLLRSKSISRVNITQFLWDKGVDKNAIENLRSGGKSVWFESTQDLGMLGVESLGIVEYKIDFSPLLKNIAKYYFNILFFTYLSLILWRIFINLLRSLPPKSAMIESTHALTLAHKDYAFLGFAFVLCAGICAFSFWLGFPGFIIDADTFRMFGFDFSNYGPIINSLFIGLITAIFGKHTFYPFLLNCLTLYLGIFFLIAGFYLRFRSILSLTIILIAFIGNIYLGNFVAMNYILMANFIFCAYSVILFLILAGQCVGKKIRVMLWILAFMLLFLGLLWRHNAIFSAFPAFFVLCYIFLKDRDFDSKIFLKFYAKFIFLSAVLCLVIVVGLPKVISKDSNPQNHLLLLQIAGACVPADDSSCFKAKWYEKDKSFDNVKEAYNSNPLNGDLYACWGGKIFSCDTLDWLKFQWLKSIVKYSSNFIAHESRFFKAMWWQNPRDDDIDGFVRSVIKSPKRIQEKPLDKWRLDNLKKYPQNEWHIDFSPVKERIYTIFYNNLPVLNHIIFVVIGFALLIFSAFGIILWRKRECDKSLLIFTFSTALTAFASAFIIAAMAIVTHSRYMSPVVIFSIIALVGFVAFVLDYLSHKK